MQQKGSCLETVNYSTIQQLQILPFYTILCLVWKFRSPCWEKFNKLKIFHYGSTNKKLDVKIKYNIDVKMRPEISWVKCGMSKPAQLELEYKFRCYTDMHADINRIGGVGIRESRKGKPCKVLFWLY